MLDFLRFFSYLFFVLCFLFFHGSTEFKEYYRHLLSYRARAAARKWARSAHHGTFVDGDLLNKKIFDIRPGIARVGDGGIEQF